MCCACWWKCASGFIWGLSSSWDALELSDPVACAFLFMPGFEVVLVKASFGKLFLSLTWQASGMGFAFAYLRVSVDVCAGGFYVWHICIRGTAALIRTFPRSLRVTHIHTLVPFFSPVDSILSACCASTPLPPPPLLILSLLPQPGVLVSAPDF